MPRSLASRDGSRRGRGRGNSSGEAIGDASPEYSFPAIAFLGGSDEAIPDATSSGDGHGTSSPRRGSNTQEQAPIHPSHRPIIYLHDDGFVEPKVTHAIISILKNMFYGSWST